MIKNQYYLNISSAGRVGAVNKKPVKDCNMELKEVIKEVFKARAGYGFRYSVKQYIEKDRKKFFLEEEKSGFNFVDPVSIEECRLNKGMYKITVRNSWAVYYYERDDNIIFTTDEVEKAFKVDLHLNIINLNK